MATVALCGALTVAMTETPTASGTPDATTALPTAISTPSLFPGFSDTPQISRSGERTPTPSSSNSPSDPPLTAASVQGVSDLPPATVGKTSETAAPASPSAIALSNVSVPDLLASAYRKAAAAAPAACHLPVSLLAGIGQVESGSIAGHQITTTNRVQPGIFGPVLNGNGYAAIIDSDGGAWDGDTTWDRAVGPMQFIPGTWRIVGTDGDGDGIADPQNIFDATRSAGRYLCQAGGDLATDAGLRGAILAYNHSEDYLALVLAWKAHFETGMPVTTQPQVTPNSPATTTPATTAPSAPSTHQTTPATTTTTTKAPATPSIAKTTATRPVTTADPDPTTTPSTPLPTGTASQPEPTPVSATTSVASATTGSVGSSVASTMSATPSCQTVSASASASSDGSAPTPSASATSTPGEPTQSATPSDATTPDPTTPDPTTPSPTPTC